MGDTAQMDQNAVFSADAFRTHKPGQRHLCLCRPRVHIQGDLHRRLAAADLQRQLLLSGQSLFLRHQHSVSSGSVAAEFSAGHLHMAVEFRRRLALVAYLLRLKFLHRQKLFCQGTSFFLLHRVQYIERNISRGICPHHMQFHYFFLPFCFACCFSCCCFL